MHMHNRTVKERREKQASSVHSKTDVEYVDKFGFQAAHFFGPIFHVAGGVWESSWTVSIQRIIHEQF